MPLKVSKVTEDNCRAWKNLLQLYLQEMSAYATSSVDEDGLFSAEHLNPCLAPNGELGAYYILVKDRVAGFMVVHEESESDHIISDFFILNTYRGLGIGKDAAHQAFALWPGRWRVAAIEGSQSARTFWRRVVREITFKRYHVTHDKPRGLVYFEFNHPAPGHSLSESQSFSEAQP